MSIYDKLAQKPNLVSPIFVPLTMVAPFSIVDNGYPFEFASNALPPFQASGGALYLFQDVTWRLNLMNEDTYAACFDGFAAFFTNPLNISLSWKQTGSNLGGTIIDLPLTRYYNHQPLRIYSLTPNSQGTSILDVKMSGLISLSTWLPNPSPIPNHLTAYFMFRIFEIRDKDFIDNFNTKGIGG